MPRTKLVKIYEKYHHLLDKVRSAMILSGELRPEEDKRAGLGYTMEELIYKKALELKIEGVESI